MALQPVAPSNPVEFSKKIALYRADDTGKYVKISGITEMPDIPGGSRKTIDVTTVDDEYMQRVGGTTIDAGTITLTLLDAAANASIAPLRADLKADYPRKYKLQLKSGRYWEFWGVVTEIKPTAKNDDVIRSSVKIEICGEPAEAYVPNP